MISKSYKTTKKHFKLFKKECRYWLDRFDLGSWQVCFEHIDYPDMPSRAWHATKWKGRTSTIGLSHNWKADRGDTYELDKPTKKKVALSAFHEACELLLVRLRINADIDACPTTRDENDEITHAIIRRLEKAVWEPYWENQKEEIK